MDFSQLVEEAVVKSLNDTNKRMQRYDNDYVEAQKLVKLLSRNKIEEYKKSIPADLTEILEEAAEAKKEQVQNLFEGKALDIEMVLNTSDGVELFLPVRWQNGTSIEKDLYGHVSAALHAVDPAAKSGKLGDYVTLAGNVRNVRSLKSKIADLPEAMQVAHIGMPLEEVKIPVHGTYGTQNPYVLVKMTPSSLQYPHIPVLKRNRAFFPAYKRKFELLTEFGTVAAWVTSQTTSKPSKGNYICGYKRDGTLGVVLDKMNLKPGSEVVIEEIHAKSRYAMRKR